MTKKNDKKMTPQNRNDKKMQKPNDKKMTKINNQQPSEFAGKIFIRFMCETRHDSQMILTQSGRDALPAEIAGGHGRFARCGTSSSLKR